MSSEPLQEDIPYALESTMLLHECAVIRFPEARICFNHVRVVTQYVIC